MTAQEIRRELLKPYLMWGIETDPGIYFFVPDVPLGAGESPVADVDYLGQAEVVCRRVKFGRHHRLAGDYRPPATFTCRCPERNPST
jgi:hypothetical protein